MDSFHASVRISRFLVAAVLAVCGAHNLFGQAGLPAPPASSSPAKAPYVATMTFDVTSVRESKPDVMRGFLVGGGFGGNSNSLNLTNFDIWNLLAEAYGVERHQIQGVPTWMDRALYNVQAKGDGEAGEKLAKLTAEQVRLEQQHMVQVLLADRFHLETHWETHETLVYSLVAAKGGPKMKPGGAMPSSAEEVKDFGDRKVPELYQRGDGRLGYEFIGHECHTASLAAILKGQMTTNVIDRTGLAGTYDFDLKYSFASDARREEDPTIWPALPDAVEQQLGLKLERAKGPVEVLVVDHIEPPSEN